MERNRVAAYGRKCDMRRMLSRARVEEIASELTQRLGPNVVVRASDAYKPAEEIRSMLAPHLGDDRVFGRMNGLTIEDWFDTRALKRKREEVAAATKRGTVLVIGSGASHLAPKRDVLVYADMARREIQLRYRRLEVGNLGCDNKGVLLC